MSQTRATCSSCGTPRTALFDVAWVRGAKGDEQGGFISSQRAQLRQLLDTIQDAGPLKFGHLYCCDACGQFWYLDAWKRFMHPVPADREELLQQWNVEQLLPSTADLSVFSEIRAVKAPLDVNGVEELKIPCAISWSNGTVSDPAVILITKHPPISEKRPKAVLFRGVCEVRASEFALPYELRVATHQAPEAGFGFAPTKVISSGGVLFVIDGAANVFFSNGVKGCDVRLQSRRRWWHALTKRATPAIEIVSEPTVSNTYVYCDWFENCEELLMAQTASR